MDKPFEKEYMQVEIDRLRSALQDIVDFDPDPLDNAGGGDVIWWQDYIRSIIGNIKTKANSSL